jgi:hypothetical protein
VEKDVSQKESFGSGGGVVVSDLHEHSGCEANLFTGGNDEVGALNEFDGAPLGVSRNGLHEPVGSDGRPIGMSGGDQCEFEKGCCTPVENLSAVGINTFEPFNQPVMVA